MTTPTEDVRRRLLAGETLTSEQIQAEYGVGKSFLGLAMNGLRKRGLYFDKAKLSGKGNPQSYTLRGGTPNPGEWGKGSDVAASQFSKTKKGRRATRVTAPAAPKPRKPRGLEHPVPTLGTNVLVTVTALDPDSGEVTVGFNNGEHAWHAVISAYARIAQSDGSDR